MINNNWNICKWFYFLLTCRSVMPSSMLHFHWYQHQTVWTLLIGSSADNTIKTNTQNWRRNTDAIHSRLMYVAKWFQAQQFCSGNVFYQCQTQITCFIWTGSFSHQNHTLHFIIKSQMSVGFCGSKINKR